MPLDLWKVYKLVSQRARRATGRERETASEMKARYSRLIEKPSVKLAESFCRAERLWVKSSFGTPVKLYGPLTLGAIRQREFVVNKPVAVKTLGLGYDPQVGTLYIASCRDRPHQVKVGVTTLSIEKRFVQFLRRYDLNLTLEFCRTVPRPAMIEKAVHESLRPYRVRGNAHGDSIEWFRVSPSECIRLVEQTLIDTHQSGK